MYLFLTVLQAIVGAALVGVVLMQRSEGGGLGMGGSPSGLMSARGAADFMTRMTTILAALFVILSIALAALAVNYQGGSDVTTTLEREVAPVPNPGIGGPPVDNPLPGTPIESGPNAAPAAQVPADPLRGAAD